MSDASFRLLDKKDNEIVFNPGGIFNSAFVSNDRPIPMVKSVSLGKQRVDFQYTINNSGRVMIANARLKSGDQDAGPTYVVHYQYDSEGRLCAVTGPDNPVAEIHKDSEAKVMIAAK